MQLNLSNASIGQRNVESLQKSFVDLKGLRFIRTYKRRAWKANFFIDNFDTFIKVTQKLIQIIKFLLKRKITNRNYKSSCYQKNTVVLLKFFGVENKEVEPQMEIELFKIYF